MWANRPGELTRNAEMRTWRLRGTQERHQDDPRALTNRSNPPRGDWDGAPSPAAIEGGLGGAKQGTFMATADAPTTVRVG